MPKQKQYLLLMLLGSLFLTGCAKSNTDLNSTLNNNSVSTANLKTYHNQMRNLKNKDVDSITLKSKVVIKTFMANPKYKNPNRPSNVDAPYNINLQISHYLNSIKNLNQYQISQTMQPQTKNVSTYATVTLIRK